MTVYVAQMYQTGYFTDLNRSTIPRTCVCGGTGCEGIRRGEGLSVCGLHGVTTYSIVCTHAQIIGRFIFVFFLFSLHHYCTDVYLCSFSCHCIIIDAFILVANAK